MIKSLSVFFPVFNEEGNLVKTVESAVNFLKSSRLLWEIIIVDDGSTDKTLAVAQKLAGSNPGIRVIHQENLGYGGALKTGFAAGRYDWIVYTDADGQFDFREITNFLALTDEAQAIWGYRKNRRDPFLRHLYGLVWRRMAGLFFRIIPRDVNCGFKMIKREALKAILPLRSTRGAMINVELAHKLHKAGFTIKEVGVNHYSRRSGSPTGANLSVALKSFYELYLLAGDA